MKPRSLRSGRMWLSLALILTICSVPRPAAASCMQADIEGKWQVYAAVSAPTRALWVSCNLSVASGGAISSGTCDSPEQNNLHISSGDIRIADTTNCVFAGYFEFEEFPVQVEHATMSIDKTVVAGVGAYTRGFFTFTMIKRSAPH